MKSFEKTVDASRKEPDAAHPRVKIAVLDTGLDLSHRDIIKAKEQGRLKFRDFVDDTDTIKDDDGHGTHCTSLALKYAPNAEIFAGRVFRKSEADTDSCDILTKAIRYATDVWKVDIISLSLGFTDDDDDDDDDTLHFLRDEIWRASGNKILIFASAANNTSNETRPIRFPASMKEVICIFSSNSYGRPSDFNPDPKYDRPNLTFPGEQIEGAWPSNFSNEKTFEKKGATYKLQSGTSCSTPIAAAVAAGVLEFAWQERIPAVRRLNQLKHCTGMMQIFIRRMVDDYKVGDNSYYYVKPWKLISTSRRKNYISMRISDALDHIDG
ncbi:subtilisin-like protein [Cadophora sp. DSE1049]|nr:subtilisin-like protein [Cadophora sp. DSE1049]